MAIKTVCMANEYGICMSSMSEENSEDLIVAINADNSLILRHTEIFTVPWTGINGLITIVIFVTR